MTDYDSFYHRLFAHEGMVAQLLREFVNEAWLDDLDLDAITRENAKFHADTGKRRESDTVWRIPRRSGGHAYVLLLLEFQSTSDPWMALRLLVYAGLLWQHLVKEKRLLPDGRLPPILPIVLYNGDPRWAAPDALRNLIGLPKSSPLWGWQPDIRYFVIDEGSFGADDLAKRNGLMALLFRLESAPDAKQMLGLAREFSAWFRANPAYAAVRPLFEEWLRVMVGPLPPGVRVAEELLEDRDVLETRMEAWKQEWRQEGRQEGAAAVLLRLLERRFGKLPDWAIERISSADMPTLEKLELRVLDAATLDEVFA